MVFALLFGVFGAALFGQVIPSRTISLSIRSGRPVAEAVNQLQTIYGWVITYEDVPVMHPDDIVDHTVREIDGYRALDQRIVAFDMHNLPQPQDVTDPAMVIESVLKAHQDANGIGQFEVRRSGNIFHVVPRTVRDLTDQTVNVQPILDTRVSFPAQERSALELLEVLCAALTDQTQHPISLGIIPVSHYFSAMRVTFGADNEIARNVLVRLVRAFPDGELTWNLNYGIFRQEYALNLRPSRR
jgi:hypothetical protein